MSDGGVCITAPATPSLLIIDFHYFYKLKKVKICMKKKKKKKKVLDLNPPEDLKVGLQAWGG